MTITYRSIKGSKLTSAEADGNILHLVNKTEETDVNILNLTNKTNEHDAKFLKVPTLITQNFSPIQRTSDNSTDTSFLTMVQITVPCGNIPMGPHSVLKLEFDVDFNNTATTKTFSIDWGGTNIGQPPYSGAGIYSSKLLIIIANAGTLTTQKIHNSSTYSVAGTQHITTNKDTSGDVTLEIKAKWNALLPVETEKITLLGYSLWHYPGN